MKRHQRLEDLAGEIKICEERSRPEDTPPTHTRARKKREAPAVPSPPHKFSQYAHNALYGLGLAVWAVFVYATTSYIVDEVRQQSYVARVRSLEENRRIMEENRTTRPYHPLIGNRDLEETRQPDVPPQQPIQQTPQPTIESELAHIGERFTEQIFNEPQQQVSQQTIDSAVDLPEEITNSIGMRLRLIPAGSFMMGSPSNEPNRNSDEGPRHTVTFSEPFYLGVHEVTVEQYSRFVEVTGYTEPDHVPYLDHPTWSEQIQHPSRPVTNITWEDAVAFCAWLTETEHQGIYRLPSEAQWEYACRAGTTTAFNTGRSLNTNQANIDPDGRRHYDWMSTRFVRDVGSFDPNAWGLHDMHGNVHEWCQDRYHINYEGAPTDGSAWERGGEHERVIRGGSWYGEREYSRSAYRGEPPGWIGFNSGFRVSRTAEKDVWTIISD